MNQTLQASWDYVLATAVTSFGLLLPRIVGALTALVVGVVLAKLIRGLVWRVLHAIAFSKFVSRTPLQFALQNENLGEKIEDSIANTFYWLSVLVVIYIMVAILGLGSVTVVLEKILGYIPNVISAMFIVLFGVLVAGWVESLVKGAVRAIDQRTSRLAGKIASYFVVSLATITALSELGIAAEFLTIIFIGFVAMLSLGFGLALGLGGKAVVEKVLLNWYEKNLPSAPKAKRK
jgi:hypothetical protein